MAQPGSMKYQGIRILIKGHVYMAYIGRHHPIEVQASVPFGSGPNYKKKNKDGEDWGRWWIWFRGNHHTALIFRLILRYFFNSFDLLFFLHRPKVNCLCAPRLKVRSTFFNFLPWIPPCIAIALVGHGASIGFGSVVSNVL